VQHICIFEDNKYQQLNPLIYTRATFELRCGIFTPLERIVRYYPDAYITLFCRDYFSDILKERYAYSINTNHQSIDTCLFINGRAIISNHIPINGQEEVGIQDDTVVYARLKSKNINKLSSETFVKGDAIKFLKDHIPTTNTQATVINYFWDIIKFNKSQLEKDFTLFLKEGNISGKPYEGVYFLNKDMLFIGNNCKIKPCCVLDAEKGPIYIGDNVTISPNTTIEGPAYVGNHSIIQPNSRLREGANIGEYCKIGGEVVNSIFHSYSNKQHDGFIGDSYIGSWVNLGADTVNSNLLNTYGNIKVEFEGNNINTDLMFLGMAMGDHTKTAINTTIMTGSVFGFSCNIVTSDYPLKCLPSFTWYANNRREVYNLEKALQVTKIAMKRRNKEMTCAEEQLFRKVFQLTEKERKLYQT